MNKKLPDDNISSSNANKRFGEKNLYFAKFLKNPFTMGSVVPTSQTTAKYLAQNLKNSNTDEYILELGAGTGSLTQGMIDSGINPTKLICLEIDEKFCQFLTKKFNNSRIICGDVCDIEKLISADILCKISNVISAIPLLTMMPAQRTILLNKIVGIIGNHGRYIQVSYSPFSPVPWKSLGLKQYRYGTIWKNFPPISIFGYEKK